MKKIFFMEFILLFIIKIVQITSESKTKKNISQKERKLQADDYELDVESIYYNDGTEPAKIAYMHKDAYRRLKNDPTEFICIYEVEDSGQQLPCDDQTVCPEKNKQNVCLPEIDPGKYVTVRLKKKTIPDTFSNKPDTTGDLAADVVLFENCDKLVEARFKKLNSPLFKNLGWMFVDDVNLREVVFEPTVNFQALKSLTDTFKGCTSLEEVDFSGVQWGNNEVVKFTNTFKDCVNLKKVDFGPIKASTGAEYGDFLTGCSKLCVLNFTGAKTPDNNIPATFYPATLDVDNIYYHYGEATIPLPTGKTASDVPVYYNEKSKTCSEEKKLNTNPQIISYEGTKVQFKLGTTDKAEDTEEEFDLNLRSHSNPAKCKVAAGSTDVICELDGVREGQYIRWFDRYPVSDRFVYDKARASQLGPLTVSRDDQIVLQNLPDLKPTYKNKKYSFQLKADEISPAAPNDVSTFILPTDVPDLKDNIICGAKPIGGYITCSIDNYDPKSNRLITINPSTTIGNDEYSVTLDSKSPGYLKLPKYEAFRINKILSAEQDPNTGKYTIDLDMDIYPSRAGQTFTMKLAPLEEDVTCEIIADDQPVKCSFTTNKDINGKIVDIPESVTMGDGTVTPLESDINSVRLYSSKPAVKEPEPTFKILSIDNQQYDPATNTLTYDLDVKMEPYKAGTEFKLQLDEPETAADCKMPEIEGQLVRCTYKPNVKPARGHLYNIKPQQNIDGPYKLDGMRAFNGLDNTEPYFVINDIKNGNYDPATNKLNFYLDVDMFPYKPNQEFKVKLEDPETEATCITPVLEGELVKCTYDPKVKPENGKVYQIKPDNLSIDGQTFRLFGDKTFDGLEVSTLDRKLRIDAYHSKSYDDAAKKYYFSIDGALEPEPTDSPYYFNLTFQERPDIQAICNKTNTRTDMQCYLNMNGKEIQQGLSLNAIRANDTSEQQLSVIDLTGLYFSGFQIDNEVIGFKYYDDSNQIVDMYIVQFLNYKMESKSDPESANPSATITTLSFVTEVIIINQKIPHDHSFELYVKQARLRTLQNSQTAFCKLRDINPFVTIQETTDYYSYYAYYNCDLSNPSSNAVEYVGTDRTKVRATTGNWTNTVINEQTAGKPFDEVFIDRGNQKAGFVDINMILPGTSYNNGTYSFEADITCDPSDICKNPFYLNDGNITCYAQGNGRYMCYASQDCFDSEGNLIINPYLYTQEPPAIINAKNKANQASNFVPYRSTGGYWAHEKDYDDGGGLKAWHIVLIILGALLAIAIAVCVYLMVSKKNKEEEERKKNLNRLYYNSNTSLTSIPGQPTVVVM